MARKDVIYAVCPMIMEKRLLPNSQLSLFIHEEDSSGEKKEP